MAPGGQCWRPVQTCSLEDPPLVLTSGGYRGIYRWQEGSMHPTIIQSCPRLFSLYFSNHDAQFMTSSIWVLVIKRYDTNHSEILQIMGEFKLIAHSILIIAHQQHPRVYQLLWSQWSAEMSVYASGWGTATAPDVSQFRVPEVSAALLRQLITFEELLLFGRCGTL